MVLIDTNFRNGPTKWDAIWPCRNAQTWLNIRPGILGTILDLKAIDFADFDPIIVLLK
jgi:hypothetical protein